jgi:hypothetical protein
MRMNSKTMCTDIDRWQSKNRKKAEGNEKLTSGSLIEQTVKQKISAAKSSSDIRLLGHFEAVG